MIDYIARLLAYLFNQDKEAHPAPTEGKAALQNRLQNERNEESDHD